MAVFWVVPTRDWRGAAGKSTFLFGVLHFTALVGFGMAAPDPQHAFWWSALLYAAFGWLSGGWVVLDLRGIRRLPRSWRTRVLKLVLMAPAAGLGLWVNPVAGWDVSQVSILAAQVPLWAPIAAQGLCVGVASWYFFRDFS